ncbi:peptidoglycan/xylan/chitin deacetylase (PgdA/CDA1 family) [Sporomusaceae bacterium BoRhaA]|uniref:polysaccharide deacetylase family protein n=1 Tax=Pelorhabdus rhamnosifermentans TaxID=2772457 RepID=UPI001C062C46|nr:polysaccharide deacetylase family protein [Pelorhabdus rhamnosifermentans]MBU2701939.1 peptidoglycan/xylan/chitin deacetylase (PgdA/CDA1 family) [Pelorhabdus rhamnosifermentans]
MKNKKIVLSLVLLICICLTGVLLLKDFFTTQTGGNHRNITDAESFYNADAEIIQALGQMKNSQEKATVITHSNSGQRVIALTFDGLTDRTIVQQILDLLKKYHAKATFFVDGVQTAEDPQIVVNIKNAGQQVENYTLSGMVKMENLPMDRLVKDFCRAQKIVQVTTDKGPNLLKCNDTNYTDQLLQAAKACGFKSVVKSDAFLNVKQINSLHVAADNFVGNIRPGSIISVKLKTNIEPIINEQGKTDLKPAIDKQPGLKELPKQEDLGEKEIVDAVEKLLIALEKANYTTVYVENFSKNNITQELMKTTLNDVKEVNDSSFLVNAASLVKEQIKSLFSCRTAYAAENIDSNAQEIKTILTTESALSYTFGGLSNEGVVNDVLERLNRLGIKATFFVTETEMKKYPETVRKIIENGHEIGIAIRPKNEETFDKIRENITRCRKMLEEQFGVTTNLIKQPSGIVADTTKEAVSTLKCKLIGQSMNVVQTKHKDYTSADQVLSEIFRKSMISLARGQILYFRMDYYTNDQLVGNLMEIIKQRKVDNIAYAKSYDNPASNPANDSQYMIKPVGEILNNTKFIYQYPVDLKNVPVRLRNDGAELNIDQHNFLSEASKRYIGNKDVTYEDRMLGFSKMEIRRLDKSGFIHTEDNVIFLTFDDWGTDAAINKLLYVLRKHNVKATFFVLTNNVLNNPNLLRAIAMAGHDIGDHSDKHKPMVIRDEKTGKQVETQGKEEYVRELATSYQKLRAVTGDVIIDGKPALTRFFRPPTLAISKMGLESLFETGYEYIICGSCSTGDYDAKNVSQLLKTIEDGVYTQNGEVRKGAMLVCHMSDNATYTAMALDILLTANEAKADSDPSKFKVGRLSDYLPDGYSQMEQKKSLQLNSHDKV